MVDHSLIRIAVMSAVNDAIPTLRDSSLYDLRVETLEALPFAALWRERTYTPDTLSEFGHYDVVVDWTLRVYLREESGEEASEAAADMVTERLFDAFKDGGSAMTLTAATFRVDTVRIGDVTVDDRGGTPRLLVVEAGLVTALVTT